MLFSHFHSPSIQEPPGSSPHRPPVGLPGAQLSGMCPALPLAKQAQRAWIDFCPLVLLSYITQQKHRWNCLSPLSKVKNSRFSAQGVKIHLIMGRNLFLSEAKSTHSTGIPAGSHQDFPELRLLVLFPSLSTKWDGQLKQSWGNSTIHSRIDLPQKKIYK